MKSLFYDLKKRDQTLICHMLQERSKFSIKPLIKGEDPIFDDVDSFNQVLREMPSVKFNGIYEKEKVYQQVSELGGHTCEHRWGEQHAFDHVLRLIDAMGSVE